ncbi:G-type lectin S-receptor-like serine/threonine-protein kinase [Camellia lanceoleosa]|uniref:G-type lectin S-receptor-like serine/threonine-protein kinase n=1 Tax=Camellia lanceoleosa TaxID=1840588 RepID=A0ACC0HF18_9ERIC|nr:G-type lectin S-receptor-like serine/threonine-protein kinase [Camellia lanceoleosa]
MDASGQIKVVTWLKGTKKPNVLWTLPAQQCEVYAFCGAFGTCNQNKLPFCNCPNGFNPATLSNDWNSMSYSARCTRRTKLVCGNSEEKDMFLEYPNMRLPKHPRSVAVRSAEECESTCLSNCSCTAYVYNNDRCSIWIGNLFNMQELLKNDDRGRTLYLRVAVSKYSSEDSMVKLDRICREANVMLVFAHSYGLTGFVRISVKGRLSGDALASRRVIHYTRHNLLLINIGKIVWRCSII